MTSDAPIRIDRITIREISLPLRVPFQISGGTMHVRRSLIVEMRGGGLAGYGESAPFEFPFYSSETVGSVFALYRDLYVPRLTGKSFASVAELDAELRRGVRGNPFARCGMENAFRDLLCQAGGVSLQRMIELELEALGVGEEFRRPAPRVASGVAVGIPEDEDPARLKEWIAAWRDEGYRRVKIKIRPGWDEVACRAARETLGDDFMLWTDANASYDLTRDRDRILAMEEFGLAFHEQPLHHDDILDHARLGREIRTPVCLDESLKSERVGRQVLETDGPRIWNIKIQRMGGLTEAIGVYALAVANRVRLWGGTMPESGIGAQPILALASFPGFVYPADIEPGARWYEPDTDPVSITMDRDGWIGVPGGTSIGERIDRDLYERRSRVLPI